MSKDDDYLFDKSGDADPEVAKLETVLGSARYVSPDKNRADRVHHTRASSAPAPRRRLFPLLAPLALAAAVVVAILLQKTTDPVRPSLDVTTVAGTTHVDERALGPKGRLAVGAWLETDPASRAEIELRQIGHVTVGPESRLRIAALGANEQRLELTRGVIEAKVTAVPRLFVVDTPSARATDLGCAYRLEVVPNSGTFLRVTSGAVELAGAGRQAHVPAGATCETRPARGPGCPYFDDASDAFKGALRHIDFDTEHDATWLDTLLTTARVRDTLTLWQLVWRFDATKESEKEQRTRVIARVLELVPLPPGVDLSGGSPSEFQKYQDHLAKRW